MRASADQLPQGGPYAIAAAIEQVLRAEPSLAGATIVNNPLTSADLPDGERVVFIEDQLDKSTDQPGQRVKRTYTFVLGVISRAESDDARRAAHTDYRAAKRALRLAGMARIGETVRLDNSGLTEGEVRFRLENIDVGGALVLGMFSVDYRDPF